MFCRLERGEILIYDLASGKERELPLSGIWQWKFSRGENQVAAGVQLEPRRLRIIRSDKPGMGMTSEFPGAIRYAVSPDGKWIIAADLASGMPPGALMAIRSRDGTVAKRFHLERRDDNAHNFFHFPVDPQFTTDGKRLIFGGDDGWLAVVEIAELLK